MSIVFRRCLACAALAGAALPSHAGLMWFSRANCLNNESITWDWLGQEHTLWTGSRHLWRDIARHDISTGWATTSRSAAIHWGEGLVGGYQVTGEHWRWLPGYGLQYLGQTTATDCNLGELALYW